MEGEDFLNGGMGMGGDMNGDPTGEMGWEQSGGHITLFDETSPRYFNDSFASPAPPETPMLGGAAKVGQLYNDSDFLAFGQPLQPRSMDGGSSASPESSVPDSSSESSRSRKRKTSTALTSDTMDLGWATHEGSLSPQTHQLKQETDRAVDAMGTQMASQFPDFSVPNSPDPPLEQTITPSKLQQNFGVRHQGPATTNLASTSRPAFFLGGDSRDGSPSSGNALSSQANSPNVFSGYQSPSPMTRNHMPTQGTWDTNSQWTNGQAPVFTGIPTTPFGTAISPALFQGGDAPPELQASLHIGSETGKSRVETQIKITLSLDPMPAGITALHLPTCAISKAKLLANEKDTDKFANKPETLELTTLLVCASAMQKGGHYAVNQALRRAAGYELIPERRASSDSGSGNDVTSDPGHPLNGGSVTICEGCIAREKKRAGRKRAKKSEDEALWERYGDQRVVLFNDKEFKEWEITAGKDNAPVSPIPMSQDARHITVPMRIACYCRHHGEKLGFQVIFTIKNSQGQLIAQNMTQPIIITDDHKTNTTPGGLPANVQYGDIAQFGSGPDVYENEHSMMRAEYRRPYHSATDLVGMAQQFSPYPPQQMSGKSSGYQSHAMHSRNASRQASPSAQTGPNKKRKPSASAHHKIPSGLSMTRLDEMVTRPVSNAPLSAGLTGLPSTLPLSTGPFMQSPEAPILPISMPMQSMNADARSNAMGPSIPAPMKFEPANQHMNYDQLPDNGAYFSTPNSAYASRSGSPTERSIANTQTAFERGMPTSINPIPTMHQFQPQQERPFQTFPNSLASPTSGAGPNTPAINKIIPERGSISGGYEVTCLGSNFHRGMEVMFGDQLATTTTYWGISTLVCLVPPGTKVGEVYVTLFSRLPDGRPQQLNQSGGRFTYFDDEMVKLTEMTMHVLSQQTNGSGTEKDIMRNILTSAANSQGNFSSNSYHSGRQQHRQAATTDKAAAEESFLEILNVLDMHDGIYLPQYNLQLPNGSTMLSLAAGLGFTRLVAGLLARGADPDIRDKGGYTPLMVASMRGHTQIIRRLILRGADPTVRSLRGYVAEDLTPNTDVSDILRHTPYHSRTRSAGAISMRSRASSVASTRSLWEGPSQASASGYSSVIDADTGENSTTDDATDTEEPTASNIWIRSRRNSTAIHVQHPHSAALEPEQQQISPAAFLNWGNQLAAQIQQFQQNVRTFQLPVNLQDYQAYPVVRRISSLVPHRMQVPLRTESSSSEATVVEEPSWRNYIPFQSVPSPPPPSYDHLYPEHGESSSMVKKLHNVAEDLLDQKAATMESTMAKASSSVAPVTKSKLDVRIGRKPLSKEKQEALREAHALLQLKRTTTDRNLWFFWFPLLLTVVGLMLYNFLPNLFSSVSSVAASIGSSVIRRVVEIA